MQTEDTACGMLHPSLPFHVDAVSGMVWLRDLGQTITFCGRMFQPRGCLHLQINNHSSNINSNSNMTHYAPPLVKYQECLQRI
jgi:hypothetical protein